MAKKRCDFCKSAPALLFCRKDKAYFCMACDTKLHGQIKHEHVWMCEVCEQSPACVTCKADAAVLCVECDRDIHSANPLARRHVRIPVVPFCDSAEAVVNSTVVDPVFSCENTHVTNEEYDYRNIVMKSVDLLDPDRLLNFSFGRFESQFVDSSNDAVVPVQSTITADRKSTGNCFEFDFNGRINNSHNNSNTQSHSNSVSMPNSLLRSLTSQI